MSFHSGSPAVTLVLLAMAMSAATFAGAARRAMGGLSDESWRLALALVWAGVGALLLQFEGIRERFATHFLLADWAVVTGVWAMALVVALSCGLVTGPVLIGSAGDASGTAKLRPAAAALGVALGLVVAALLDRASVVALIAPLALFAAAAIAALRRERNERSPGAPLGAAAQSRAFARAPALGTLAFLAAAVFTNIEDRGKPLPAGGAEPLSPGRGEWAAQLGQTPGCRVLRVDADRLVDVDSEVSFWTLDLSIERADLVVLSGGGAVGGDDSRGESRRAREWGRRTIRRLYDRVQRGGRLVIEWPTLPPIASALRRYGAHAADATGQAFVLTARDASGERHAVVIGKDVPEWLGRLPRTDGVELTLRRWKDGGGPFVVVETAAQQISSSGRE